MKPVIAANWKMNLDIKEVATLIKGVSSASANYKNIELIISPSHCYLRDVSTELKGGHVASQTISEFDSGAYTGEVSAKMSKSCGATFTLLGHSERRHVFFETNDMIQKKLNLCKQYQLTPILCVGETLEERNSGQVKSVISNQLNVIREYDEVFYIAYEPVWAIGTGQTATPEIAEDVHAFIRKEVGEGIPILYGGSVNANNVDALLKMPSINGALIGGASLKLDEFTKIMQIADELESESNE